MWKKVSSTNSINIFKMLYLFNFWALKRFLGFEQRRLVTGFLFQKTKTAWLGFSWDCQRFACSLATFEFSVNT